MLTIEHLLSVKLIFPFYFPPGPSQVMQIMRGGRSFSWSEMAYFYFSWPVICVSYSYDSGKSQIFVLCESLFCLFVCLFVFEISNNPFDMEWSMIDYHTFYCQRLSECLIGRYVCLFTPLDSFITISNLVFISRDW